MLKDKEQLEMLQTRLAENEYFRHNVINDLFKEINDETGNLNKDLNIPRYERDELYLFHVIMEELGYGVEYAKEEYNSYHECFCYRIRIY